MYVHVILYMYIYIYMCVLGVAQNETAVVAQV